MRAVALIVICIGSAGLALGAVNLAFGGSTSILGAASFLGFLIFGLIQLTRYRHKVRAFELEHGTDAGKQ